MALIKSTILAIIFLYYQEAGTILIVEVFSPLYLEMSSKPLQMINYCHKLLERNVVVHSSSYTP